MRKLEFWKLEIKFGNRNFEELFKDEILKNKYMNKQNSNNENKND